MKRNNKTYSNFFPIPSMMAFINFIDWEIFTWVGRKKVEMMTSQSRIGIYDKLLKSTQHTYSTYEHMKTRTHTTVNGFVISSFIFTSINRVCGEPVSITEFSAYGHTVVKLEKKGDVRIACVCVCVREAEFECWCGNKCTTLNQMETAIISAYSNRKIKACAHHPFQPIEGVFSVVALLNSILLWL